MINLNILLGIIVFTLILRWSIRLSTVHDKWFPTICLSLIDFAFLFCLTQFLSAEIAMYVLPPNTATGGYGMASIIYGIGSMCLGLLGLALQGSLNSERKWPLIDKLFVAVYLLPSVLLLMGELLIVLI